MSLSLRSLELVSIKHGNWHRSPLALLSGGAQINYNQYLACIATTQHVLWCCEGQVVSGAGGGRCRWCQGQVLSGAGAVRCRRCLVQVLLGAGGVRGRWC